LGEILSLAIPDHMPRISIAHQDEVLPPNNPFPAPKLDAPLQKRSALLSGARQFEFRGERFPDWSLAIAHQALDAILLGKSSILVVPEQSQINVLRRLFELAALEKHLAVFGASQKKSERYQNFHRCLNDKPVVALGTRSAIYAPVSNLGLVALFDDLDDSLREQGSPFTHARELALMRASDADLLLVANYRSIEVQRLVEIGYLSDHTLVGPPPRIAYSEPSSRMDSASFELIRERVEQGPILVLLPRKGSSPAAFCSGCGERLSCLSCGGPVWEPSSGAFSCRVCRRGFTSCKDCGAARAKSGRAGSNRTVAELGKAFPQTLISEATADKQPSKILAAKQIIVSTPGSSPTPPNGYAAVLILDCDIWLASHSLQAEQIAIRDWMEAIELLSDTGRAVIAGVPSQLGQAITLSQHRQLAKVAYRDLVALNLPPAVRVAHLEATSEVLVSVLEELRSLGAQEIRTELGESANALIRFNYQLGPKVGEALRRFALKTNARLVGANKRRGLRVAMDDWSSL
jgi:primosomal protein N' (replication factor Y)